VIPPILDLLNGTPFLGAPGRAKTRWRALQAALISTIAQGVLGGSLDWNLVGLGAAIGVVALAVDGAAPVGPRCCSPLAVGMGMYLPTQTTGMVVIGAILGHLTTAGPSGSLIRNWRNAWALTATGLIVGDGLFNIAYAAIVAATNNPDLLAVVHENPVAMPLGIAVFGGLVGYAYWRMRRDGAAR
jgi:putative OPT family oligopeptide transporter